MKAMQNDQSTYSKYSHRLDPIPKWITLYGFVILISLCGLMFVLSNFIRVPIVLTLEVFKLPSSGLYYIETDSFNLTRIKHTAAIRISNRNNVDPQTLEVLLDYDKVQKRGSKFIIPLDVRAVELRSIAAEDVKFMVGEIVIREKTLFSEIASKTKAKEYD